jgi:hypothetical protein
MPSIFGKIGRVEGVNAKSTAMSPILWLIAVVFSGTGTLYWATQEINIVYCGLFFIFCLLVYAMKCYDFFMKNDPDRLQSERFSIKKMELQQGQIGDNTSGLINQSQARIIDTESVVKDGEND